MKKHPGFKTSRKEEIQSTKKLKENNTRYINDVDNYVHHIDDDDSFITVTVGGVPIELLLVLGSKCNLLTEKTWKKLKDKKIQVYNQIKNPDKVFMPYGKTTFRSNQIFRI